MIRNVRPEDRPEWLRMRKALWDDCPDEQQKREIDEILGGDIEVVFVAERRSGGLCGFLEAALRSRADGCDPTPVGYIVGWLLDVIGPNQAA
jgi:aminoglycoside 6'-N-acetyltransferase I